MDILVVVDMQNDFVAGSLGSEMAQAIVPNVAKKVKQWKGSVIYTRDTHGENYLETLEGQHLPVEHCIVGTHGHNIVAELLDSSKDCQVINKSGFGSLQLVDTLLRIQSDVDSITLVGLCTDICVIANAMLLKSALINTPITVDSSCCAGVTVESHNNALNAMKGCQINII